jgi:hypothetical protein
MLFHLLLDGVPLDILYEASQTIRNLVVVQFYRTDLLCSDDISLKDYLRIG